MATQLRRKNDEVRQLIAERNEERMEQIAGILKAERRASDEAYAVLVLYTNAFAALNPNVRAAQNLVRQMQEDLEYFRQHAMASQNHTGKSYAKVIRMVRSPKTNAYMFKEEIVAADAVQEYLKKK